MNFLLHRHVALEVDAAVEMGVGAMLPDLWAMADRRVKPRRLGTGREASLGNESALVRGVVHHLRTDTWFHSRTQFAENERATREALREAARGEARKLGLFAHVGWEMCLDGALVRSVGATAFQDAFTESLRRVPLKQLVVAASRLDTRTVAATPGFSHSMERIVDGLCSGEWIARYAHGEGLVELLAGIRRRFGFERFTPSLSIRLAETLEGRLAAAERVLPSLLEACRADVPFEPMPRGAPKW